VRSLLEAASSYVADFEQFEKGIAGLRPSGSAKDPARAKLRRDLHAARRETTTILQAVSILSRISSKKDDDDFSD
jgi:hypothetical protein